MSSPASTAPGSEGRVAFSHPDFTRYQFIRFFVVAALEMQSVAIGWQIYEISRRPLDLGLIGLINFLPGILLFLVAGHVADRFSRRGVLVVCYAGFAVCSSLLITLTTLGVRTVLPIYAVTLLLGTVRSFNGPAGRAILPQLVPEEHFQNAVTWNATTFQAATILGPSIGGFLYALAKGPTFVYGFSAVLMLGALAFMLRIRLRHVTRSRPGKSAADVLAGLVYIWRKKVILGSISLDLFAVLLGGAVALLPVYAKEILHTGPWGLGLLRSAPGVGALLTAVFLAHNPLRSKVGAVMLWCVAGFGVFTIAFGLSRNLFVSLIALVLVGASDMVSVVIRSTLVQIATPDEMRGRVTAVDMVFIGASNELGQFESGLTAHWFGTVPAVILGGVGTLVVIALWSLLFPDLRRAQTLSG